MSIFLILRVEKIGAHRLQPPYQSDEETDDPLYADRRNFYKVEKCSRDGKRIDSLIYAGNGLRKARSIFLRMTERRPSIRLTIRQRTRVLEQWPKVTP